jgi:hypothetical protein
MTLARLDPRADSALGEGEKGGDFFRRDEQRFCRALGAPCALKAAAVSDGDDLIGFDRDLDFQFRTHEISPRKVSLILPMRTTHALGT